MTGTQTPRPSGHDDETIPIDDLRRDDLVSALGTPWRAVSDRVMGGLSDAALTLEEHGGRRCLRLGGEVRLDNNGGFIQMALDLDPQGGHLDARPFTGVRLVVLGNDERYAVHLRTASCVRPWQSYRARFEATPRWQTVQIPFDGFAPHRVDAPLDPASLRRIGLVAIGRAFCADLCLARLELYR